MHLETYNPKVFPGIPSSQDILNPGDMIINGNQLQIVLGSGLLATISGVKPAGQEYFVNNITGKPTNDGLSWATAMDQVSTAIAVSEAFRLAAAALNVYVRNTIYIQATGTPYTACTLCPNYTDIVGIGAFSRGNGSGIATIDGVAANTPALTGAGAAGEMRGCRWFNIKFAGNGTSCYVVDLLKCFRTEFIDCAFMQDNTAGHPVAGLRIQTSAGAVHIKNCMFGSDTEAFTYGIYIGGTHFNNCLVEDCVIDAATAGVYIASTVTADQWTVWQRNKIGGLYGTCAIGIDDDNVCGYSMYVDNYIVATNCMDLATRPGYRALNNHEIEAGVAAIEMLGS